MKLLLKLALVAVVANATWHLFTVYSENYKFRDAVQYAAESRGNKTDEQLREAVLAIAARTDLPLDEEHLTVRHEETHTIVDGSYTRTVEVFPGLKYEWPFTAHVDAYAKAERLPIAK
jgi:hypothetical protein